MLKCKLVLPNQDQRRTNSVPTPYFVRKNEICTFADGGKGVPCPPPPSGVEVTSREPSPPSQFLNTYFTLWHVQKLVERSECSAVRLVV